MALGTVYAMPASSADIPGVDEVVSSPNVSLIANVPKQGNMATEAAFGTDIAFHGKYAIAGNYLGFVIYDISKPKTPTIVSQVNCPGSQNDVSVTPDGDLLFLSTDSSRSDDSCQSVAKPVTDPTAWEGIKVFDISNKANPRYIKAVETKCGSHTHTLLPGKGKDRKNAYVYVSSYILDPATGVGPDCQLPHDKVSIVKVPLRAPTQAAVVAEPVLFPDGGNPGGGQTTYPTSGCHDLTVYPDKDLMAGACMGDGALFDISNPLKPKTLDVVRDTVNFAFWHSATFNNKANKIVFTDELGGGGAATCNPEIGPNRGANAIYEVVGKGKNRSLRFRSYYKIPRANAPTENCVAHNGSLIPVPGKDIMVQSWYQGGISFWDFTDARRPKEIGYIERGPLSTDRLILGGTWSAYWYNGYVFSSDIQKGLDVVQIKDRRTDVAKHFRLDHLNTQTQPNLFR